MQLISAQSYAIMPWKNGLGKTAEVAVFPTGATTADFLWRISIADVTGPGPFSRFPGVERTIAQLSGPPMTLHFPEQGKVHTLRRFEPYAFSGDLVTTADLAGKGTDFNVMVRRGHFNKAVSLLCVGEGEESTLTVARELVFVYCAEGEAKVGAESSRVVLHVGDTVLIDDGLKGEGRVLVSPCGGTAATLLVVRIVPAGSPPGHEKG